MVARDWGPDGEWEARTVDSGLPLVVCNRSGRGDESHISEAESVIVDRGVKLLRLRSSESTVFIVDCLIRDGHIKSCELAATVRVPAEVAVPLRNDHSHR